MDLIKPYGDLLVDLMVPEAERAELKAYGSRLPSIQISERTVCDLELLATGAFRRCAALWGKPICSA